MVFTNDEINLITDNNFKKLLSEQIISDIFVEQTITTLRKKLCLFSVENKINDIFISFLESLSCQCFLTEYVYEESDEESQIINSLIDKCKTKEYFQYLPLIACYRNLFPLIDQISYIKSYPIKTEKSKYFIQLHIEEPLKEFKISKSIETIGKITNNISKEVKNQYEINPYPRWKDAYTDDKVFPVEHMLHQLVCDDCKNLNQIKSPKVLIAGCGTGIHIINYRGYDVDKVIAIDLSKKSLSFAKRKANEYKMQNVQFFQMDILNLHLLEETFEIIECTGVLHHMEDINKGLGELTKRLSSNGYMKLGLYSEKARSIIYQAHEEIIKYNFQPTEEGIKKFRREVISGSLTHLQKITTTIDFYSISTCRDLCFHVHEKFLNIKDIVSLLELNQLKFCGFELPYHIKQQYQHLFPNDVQLTDLNNWEIFEQNNPDTFLRMYQFWVKHIN